MKIKQRIIATAITAVMGICMMMAQQIAVVSKTGTTTVCQTLKEAIEGATPGSVIYLPGGGFQIGDTVKIITKLSIVGLGYKANSVNVDGNTVISGNLFFDGGLTFGSVKDSGTYFSLGVRPGLAVKLCDEISFVAHLGFLGFENYSPKGGGKSGTSFGLEFANSCSFGVYYNF